MGQALSLAGGGPDQVVLSPERTAVSNGSISEP